MGEGPELCTEESTGQSQKSRRDIFSEGAHVQLAGVACGVYKRNKIEVGGLAGEGGTSGRAPCYRSQWHFFSSYLEHRETLLKEAYFRLCISLTWPGNNQTSYKERPPEPIVRCRGSGLGTLAVEMENRNDSMFL